MVLGRHKHPTRTDEFRHQLRDYGQGPRGLLWDKGRRHSHTIPVGTNSISPCNRPLRARILSTHWRRNHPAHNLPRLLPTRMVLRTPAPHQPLPALVLATIVGLITVRGDILALNTQSFSPDYYSLLAPRRMVYPFWAQTTLAAIVGLLLLGVFVPALVFARKNLSKMSRTVRFA